MEKTAYPLGSPLKSTRGNRFGARDSQTRNLTLQVFEPSRHLCRESCRRVRGIFRTLAEPLEG
jgi:hypothetical protein